MRIACLQFAPLTGDIDNNLNRADSVLNKSNQAELDGIDLLVLPELAFTGSNFKSLQEISPFLEPPGSGISALWARTTALKYNCAVAIGYPEKVDVTPSWPTSPEYYNSTIVVNGEGETVATCRKSSLTPSDEKWALEGKDGFFSDFVDGIGHTSMGISSDIFPSKYSPSWADCEFAIHALDAGSNVIIVTMSWRTSDEPRMFSRMPQEPDMDALTSWTQRFLPLIKVEGREETIVIFCNRCGSDGDVAYAGTSTVLGIKDGEVSVYGLLGRGVKELLVVDTDAPPFAKLVQHDIDRTSEVRGSRSIIRQRSESGTKPSQLSPGLMPDMAWPCLSSPVETAPRSPSQDNRTMLEVPPINTHSKQERSPTPTVPGSKPKPRIPEIQIPESRRQPLSVETSPAVKTPTCPSPTPSHIRPQLVPRPGVSASFPPHRIFGGTVSVSTGLCVPRSPGTPFFDIFQSRSQSSPTTQSRFQSSPLESPLALRNQGNQLYWVPPRQLLKSPVAVTMSPLDSPMDRLISMSSACPPTAAAEAPTLSPIKTQAQGLKSAHTRKSRSPIPDSLAHPKEVPTKRTKPKSRSRSTSRGEPRSQPRNASTIFTETFCVPVNTKAPLKGTPRKPRSQSADPCGLSSTPPSKSRPSGMARSRSAFPASNQITSLKPQGLEPLAMSTTAAIPDAVVSQTKVFGDQTLGAEPQFGLATTSTEGNQCDPRSSPPHPRPTSRRARPRRSLEHHRSRSLSVPEQRYHQGDPHDPYRHINFTPGDFISRPQTALENLKRYGVPNPSLASSPGSQEHPRGRLPEPTRPSSMPRQRESVSSGGGCRSRGPSGNHPGYDPDEIIATISKITTDCPHHAVNRPTGPVVQSADGSLYTIELPQRVQNLAMSLLTTLPSDANRNGRQRMVRRSLVW